MFRLDYTSLRIVGVRAPVRPVTEWRPVGESPDSAVAQNRAGESADVTVGR